MAASPAAISKAFKPAKRNGSRVVASQVDKFQRILESFRVVPCSGSNVVGGEDTTTASLILGVESLQVYPEHVYLVPKGFALPLVSELCMYFFCSSFSYIFIGSTLYRNDGSWKGR